MVVLLIKEVLRSLCCDNGWSYAVSWRAKCRDSMLLMPEDAYCEDQVEVVIEKMLHQVHMVGEGMIGQVAITGRHQWIFSDNYCGELNPIGPFDSQALLQDTAEWRRQFSAGIKTIAIISVSSQSVVQFGSTQKILERMEFVDLVRSLFRQLQSVSGPYLSGNSQKAFKSESYNPPPPGASVSVLSSSNSYSDYANIKSSHDNSHEEFMAKAQCSTILTQPCNPSTTGLHKGSPQPHVLSEPLIPGSTYPTKDSSNLLQKTTTLMSDSSFPPTSRHQTAGAEAQVILSMPNMQLPQVLLQPNSCSSSRSVLSNPSTSAWSGELSGLTSMELQLLSGMGIQGSPNIFPLNSDASVSCGNAFPSFHGDPIITPLYSTNGSLDTVSRTGYGAGKLAGSHLASSFPAHGGELSSDKLDSRGAPFVQQLLRGSASTQALLEEFKPANATLALSNLNRANNPNHWTSPPLDHVNNSLTTPLTDDLLRALGVDPLASGFDGGDVFSSISVSEVPRSVQNFVGCSGDSLGAVPDGKENSSNVPVQMSADNDLFDSLGLDLKHSQGQDCWDDIILPIGSSSRMNMSTGISGSISELDAISITGPQKGFFSELGLEQLLDAVVGNVKSVANHSSDDRSSTTTVTRAGSTSVYSNQVPLAGLSRLSGSTDGLLPECNSDKTMHGSQKEALSKSMVSSWIDGSYNINTGSAAASQHKKPEEPPKNTRKRARPGESTRPRPKDRQQIQDRVKELREIVPNGAKCSIDALLDRTIKHMLFLQSVTKYADKLKQVDEPKMIGKESGVVLKDNSSGSGGRATWAFEVEGQTMVCPIIVEDLNPPGQMLVEMLCDERGFFLEIADIIRGFGLTILKGVMEVRDNKIWARFVVEVNREVTRMDIFLSLVQLLQQTTSSGSQPTKPIEGGIPVFTNCQQSPMPVPISLADRLQ
ncbi:transcription factor bHLH157-like [Magnolia sinica]|uniref:transcription factor bHLH157-like n=1 Tax=Magnolia sinica TaxID=86752 RepID=UPI002659D8F9|nr:transcription factor bHLH157-like [Magnolia sinica]